MKNSLALFFFFPLLAFSSNLSLYADRVSGSEKELNLSGNVHFFHKFGEITASNGRALFSKGRSRLQTIEVSENVHLALKGLYTLQGERAICQFEDAEVFIEMEGKEGEKCILSDSHQQILANRIYYSTLSEKIELQDIEGTYDHTFLDPGKIGAGRYAAHKLIWDPGAATMLFKEDIHIEDSTLGELFVDEQVKSSYAQTENDWDFIALEAVGNLEWRFTDEQGMKHSLSCPGTAMWDGFKRLFSMQCGAGQPFILYENEEIEIHAQKAQLLYDLPFKTHYMEFKGNIEIFSKKENFALHYAKADAVYFWAGKGVIRLEADKDRKVLLQNAKEGVDFTADGIIIESDSRERFQHIKGVGHLQCHYTNPKK